MHKWTIAVLPLALAMTTGCSAEQGSNRDAKGETNPRADAGPKASRNYALDDFTGVEVTGPDDVTIRRGDAYSITAKGPQAELDLLEIERNGATLSIGRKREGFSFSGRNHEGVAIAITLPRLDTVRLTGSGSVDADNVEGGAVKAVLTGSGDLKIAKFSGEKADLTVSGSGDIEIAGGAIKTGDISVTGSGDVDAGGLVAETLDISVTGSGNVDAQATAAADIGILGSGDVKLTGGGTCTTKTMGSGTASCK